MTQKDSAAPSREKVSLTQHRSYLLRANVDYTSLLPARRWKITTPPPRPFSFNFFFLSFLSVRGVAFRGAFLPARAEALLREDTRSRARSRSETLACAKIRRAGPFPSPLTALPKKGEIYSEWGRECKQKERERRRMWGRKMSKAAIAERKR